MLYQIHEITAGSQTSWSKAELPYIKKIWYKGTAQQIYTKHVAQILGQNFR